MYCECGNRLDSRGPLCGLCTIYKVGLQDLALTLNSEAEQEEVIRHGRRIKARLPSRESLSALDSDGEWVELVPDENGVIHVD